jgi:hypothetical protein
MAKESPTNNRNAPRDQLAERIFERLVVDPRHTATRPDVLAERAVELATEFFKATEER